MVITSKQFSSGHGSMKGACNVDCRVIILCDEIVLKTASKVL